MNKVWDWISGKPVDKPQQPPVSRPKVERQEPPQPPVVKEQRQDVVKQREQTLGPAGRFIAAQPSVKATALRAKAEREQVPTENEHQPKPKPRPTMRGPGGTLIQVGEPARPAPPTRQRPPTNADRMLKRVETAERPKAPQPPTPRPVAKSFREVHPTSDRNRSR